AVAAYACLDYLARVDATARTSTISRLTQAIGSPGRIFKLTEEALEAALRSFADGHPASKVHVTSAAGVPQLAFDGAPRHLAAEVLRTYYRETGRTTGGPLDLEERAVVGPAPLFEDSMAAGIQSTATMRVRGLSRA